MSEVAQFRKKPLAVAAIQFTPDSFEAVVAFLGSNRADSTAWSIYIVTPEGTMEAHMGWWIIKGVKGEFYPCRPDVFEATYEPVEPPP